MLDKTQTQVIFLFKLQLGHKAEEITCSINTAFGPGTTNEHIVQWWFKTLKMTTKSHSEKPAHCDKEKALLATARESLCTATKTQHSHTAWIFTLENKQDKSSFLHLYDCIKKLIHLTEESQIGYDRLLLLNSWKRGTEEPQDTIDCTC